MAAIITNINRIQRTFDFAQKNMYFGIGRTNAWDGEPEDMTPDTPNQNQTEIEDLQFIVRIDNPIYVKQDVSGEIDYMGIKWNQVSSNDIYTEEVMNLYLDITLDYSNFGLIDYRQIGLLENPQCVLGDCVDAYYDNINITSQGYLHYIDNRVVTHRQANQQEKISVILEF